MKLPVSITRNAILPSILAGVVTFAVCVWVDRFSVHLGLTEQQRVLDDIAGGLIVAVLIFFYERRRSRDLAEKLKTISLMNHHIRNALQVILYTVPTTDQTKDVAQTIRESVARIDWALREVLPGHILDFTPGAGPASAAARKASPPAGDSRSRESRPM